MKTPWALLLALAGSWVASFAGPALVSPPGAHFVVTKKEDVEAWMQGDAIVRGTLYARWEVNEEARPKDTAHYLAVVIALDPASRNALPYFQGFPLTTLVLNDPQKVLREVFPEAERERFQQDKGALLKATGSFSIRDYFVSVTCDEGAASADLRSARSLRFLKADAGERGREFKNTGC